MKTTKILVLTSVLLIACSCKTSKSSIGTTTVDENTTSGFIPSKIGEDGVTSYGSVFFDATKRSAITTVYDKTKASPKYLAEEQPDTELLFIEKITSKIGSKSTEAEIKALTDFTKELSSSAEKLSSKSNSSSYLRTSLYRLNESYYNEAVDTTYIELYNSILNNAKEIQILEMQLKQNENNKAID